MPFCELVPLAEEVCSSKAVQLFLVTLVVLLAGCGGKSSTTAGPTAPTGPSSTNPKVTAIGDSITAGFRPGVVAYPRRLQSLLRQKNPQAVVINRGAGGERTAGGLGILSHALVADRPGFVLIMLGTIDVRAGTPLDQSAANLREMLRQAKGAAVVPVIATVPRQVGDARAFFNRVVALNDLIRRVAAEEEVTLAEVFEALADESFFSSDGFHPNERGDDTIAVVFDGALMRAGYPGSMLARRAG